MTLIVRSPVFLDKFPSSHILCRRVSTDELPATIEAVTKISKDGRRDIVGVSRE